MGYKSSANIWVGFYYEDVLKSTQLKSELMKAFNLESEEKIYELDTYDIFSYMVDNSPLDLDWSSAYDSEEMDYKIIGVRILEIEWGNMEIKLETILKKYKEICESFVEEYGILPKLFLNSSYI